VMSNCTAFESTASWRSYKLEKRKMHRRRASGRNKEKNRNEVGEVGDNAAGVEKAVADSAA